MEDYWFDYQWYWIWRRSNRGCWALAFRSYSRLPTTCRRSPKTTWNCLLSYLEERGVLYWVYYVQIFSSTSSDSAEYSMSFIASYPHYLNHLIWWRWVQSIVHTGPRRKPYRWHCCWIFWGIITVLVADARYTSPCWGLVSFQVRLLSRNSLLSITVFIRVIVSFQLYARITAAAVTSSESWAPWGHG